MGSLLVWPGVAGCSVAIGAGVTTAAVGAAVIASECYDRVDVEVYDAVSGLRICDAEVVASEDGSETRFSSCYHAALTEGRWRLRIRREGYVAASAEMLIDHGDDCPRQVRSLRFALVPTSPPQRSGGAVVAREPSPAAPVAAPVSKDAGSGTARPTPSAARGAVDPSDAAPPSAAFPTVSAADGGAHPAPSDVRPPASGSDAGSPSDAGVLPPNGGSALPR